MKKIKTNNKKRVIVAMSGGIDSSVAAALLKRAGFNVSGIFMKFWSEPHSGSALVNAEFKTDLQGYNRCCSPDAERRARKVAEILNIPFYVLDARKEFKKKVVDYFLSEHKKGRTPNPCIICNKEIKFGLLLKKALSLNADYIATGHYARIGTTNNKKLITNNKKLITNNYKLLRARDKNKDQSYFLWQLSQNQLKHILFPVGSYTKTEVRKLAKKFKLPVNDIPESQEICFVQTNVYDFLKNHLKLKPGKITTDKREIIGEHAGLPLYTIGQRKGIGKSGGPYYVLAKNQKENLLVVTKNEKKLLKKELTLEKANWISGTPPKIPKEIKVKIRYRSRLSSGAIERRSRSKIYSLKFKTPQRAITPGQSAVFFVNEEVIGGGIIRGTGN